MTQKFISWNVNGIRAIEKKGFLDWFQKTQPEILALQETKAHKEQLSKKLLNVAGYISYWNSAEKKGYSGVAVFVKQKPLNVFYGFGEKAKDKEGRTLVLEYEDFYFINIYFPNGGMGPERLKFKLNFYKEFLEYSKKLIQTGKMVIVCSDVNTAHKEIDLARPKQNETNTGFLPEERAWLDKFFEGKTAPFVDTFRHLNKEPENYTWWDYKTRARERNVGWRIDYFMIDKKSASKLEAVGILKTVMGSDHCPIQIEVEV